MAAGNASPASWAGMRGGRRIAAELRSLKGAMDSGDMPQVAAVSIMDNNLFKWRLQLKNFDEGTPGGKLLNEDLAELAWRFGQDHLLLEASFPDDYPSQPLSLRIVLPRCVWLVCRFVHINTASGGGIGGPLRVDLESRFSGRNLEKYSEAAAASTFSRAAASHGWLAGSTAPAPQPAGPARNTQPPAIEHAQQLLARARAKHALAILAKIAAANRIGAPNRTAGPAIASSRPLHWDLPKNAAAQVETVALAITDAGAGQAHGAVPYDALWMLDPSGSISLADAMAALQHAGGDTTAAAEYVADCHSLGMAPSQRVATSEYWPVQVVKKDLDVARKQEVTAVLSTIERCGKISRSEVLGVERVQNRQLWVKYQRRRAVVVRAAGFAQERFLFHGSSPGVLATIQREGFNTRLAKDTGHLGSGAYFARNISHALMYAKQEPAGGSAAAVAPSAASATTTELLLCRVALGRDIPGDNTLPAAPAGGDSASGIFNNVHSMWAVYNNHQAASALSLQPITVHY